MPITIRTNNVPRHIIYGYELPERQRKEFDYLDDEEYESRTFFKYKGSYYDLGEFMRCDNACHPLNEWHGYFSDSAFSGILIKYTSDYESVIVGQYFS